MLKSLQPLSQSGSEPYLDTPIFSIQTSNQPPEGPGVKLNWASMQEDTQRRREQKILEHMFEQGSKHTQLVLWMITCFIDTMYS